MAVKTDGSKTYYSPTDLFQLQKSVGASDYEALVLAAIARPESGGNVRAVNPSSGACGLWQHLPCVGLDPVTNATAALQKYRARGTQPWAASQSKWGPDVAAITQAHGGGGSGGGFHLPSLPSWAKRVLLAGLPGAGPLALSPIPVPGLSGNPLASLFGGGIPNPLDPITKQFDALKSIAETFSQVAGILLEPKRLLKIIIGGVLLLWGISKVSGQLGGPDPANRARFVTRGAVRGAVTGGGEGAAKGAVRGTIKRVQ